MKHVFLLIVFFSLFFQDAASQTQFAFRVSFKNKVGTAGTIAHPEEYLSAHSVARRQLLKIGFDTTDLPVVKEYIDTVISKANGILHTSSRWQNNCVILVNDSAGINTVRSLPYVQRVENVAQFTAPIHLFKTKEKINTQTSIKANKSLFKTTSAASDYYAEGYEQIAMVHGDTLHQLGFRGKGQLIAVIDEGFAYVNTLPGFDSLIQSGRLLDTYNFIEDTTSVFQNSAHGTLVVSTIAGIINDLFVGTAPDANFALYISEHTGGEQPFEMDNLVAAMERADSIGADVISISLGYNSFDIAGNDVSLNLQDIDGKTTVAAKGVNSASQKGMLVVASAGNEGGTPWNKILTPGDANEALTCGSVKSDKSIASTSGRGPNYSGQIKPDVCLMGAPGKVLNNSGTVSAVGGTSIATPQLAGLAACLWQVKPALKPEDLRKIIRESADNFGTPNNDYGYGIPNFAKAYKAIVPEIDCNCKKQAIVAYPNPVKEKLTIEILPDTEQFSWLITNIQGAKIGQGNISTPLNTSRTIDLEMPNYMPSGIYILQLATDKEKTIIKLKK